MFEIKTAGTDQIGVIRTLAIQIWHKVYTDIITPQQLDYMLTMMYSHESLQYQIEKQHHIFLIAYEDNDPVGFAAYFPKDDISPTIYRLDKIYVLPERHGKGIGKKIIEHIISIIKNEGTCLLELNVNRKNKAISFYKKLGFMIIKEVDNPIGEGYFMNDYVMALTL